MGTSWALPPTLACAPTARGDSGCGCALCVPAGEGQEGTEEGASLPLRDLLRGLVGQQHASGGRGPGHSTRLCFPGWHVHTARSA